MRELRVELPAPHPAQRRVVDESQRFNVLACGRRWGKSTLGIDRIVGQALQGAPCGWFAPIYKTLLDTWRELTNVLQPVIVDKSESERRLALTGGGVVECWSMDSFGDSARGRKYARVVVDEAALVVELERAWQGTLRPMLADLRGDAWFLSTPRGMNDFHRLFSRGQDPERPDWASWQMPTATNPYISPDEIEAARLDMTESNFMQEFEAAFISWEGQIFRRIGEAATAPNGAERQDGHFYAIGCDWGRSSDFTCFVVIDCNTRTMVDIDRSNQVDYIIQRGRLRALAERWSPCVTVVEQNSIGQPIIEQLWRDGLRVHPFTTTNVSKANIIEALALALERGELRILNDPVLLAELQAFRAEPLPSGMLRHSAPAGMHDDTVMAVALALAAMAGMEAQRQQLPQRLYLNPYGPGVTSERPDFDAMEISPY